MKFHLQTIAGQNLFTGHGAGYVAVDGARYTKSILVTPDRIIEDWSATDFASLSAEHFAQFLALKPDLVPANERKVRIASGAEFLASVRELGPAVFLILCVLGSMYGGLATPSEAAAVGVFGALCVAALQGELSRTALRAIAIGSVQTCAMIALIVLGLGIAMTLRALPKVR